VFFFGLKNIGVIAHAEAGVNTLARLPNYCDFTIGVFFFDVAFVHFEYDFS
jgi:hypothetical protein